MSSFSFSYLKKLCHCGTLSLAILLGIRGEYIESKEMHIHPDISSSNEQSIPSPVVQSEIPTVHHYTLDNGMTLLVVEKHTVPRVSLQLWYHVGSKDEKTGEKGRAHLIEHMIFKGTTTLLSESDINVLTHKISANCNAFTWYDYTGYLFNAPSQNWQLVLPVMADCMVNCSFKEEHLSSEMKAVIQELKMNRDDYTRTAIVDLISAIFSDHPYHYPVVGFKHDLWSANGQELKEFYKTHYVPNNATLVVVGDVNPDEVYEQVVTHFGDIAPNYEYKRSTFHYTPDIGSKQVVLYRDIQQPYAAAAYVVPGMSKKVDHLLDLIINILAGVKSSRLYTKIVEELQLATSLSAASYNMFEHGVFLIGFEPKEGVSVEKIYAIIQQEIDAIVMHGLTTEELNRAINQARMQYYKLMEDTEQQAYKVGEAYLATGDPTYAFSYLDEAPEVLAGRVVQVLREYMRATLQHKAQVFPIPEHEQQYWHKLQQISDLEDEQILAARVRESEVEPPVYALTVNPLPAKKFNFPKAEKANISNGLKLFYYNNPATPKIDLILEFKAEHFYDPEGHEGLYGFVSRMLMEGTSTHTARELAQEIESRGMSINAYPGGITLSMLSSDFEKGLSLLNEILTDSIFDKKQMEKVRAQILADVKNFWDEPSYFIRQLVRDYVYKDQIYRRNSLGTIESIKSITRTHLLDFYKKYITPQGAKISIVGNLQGYNVPEMVQRCLGAWQGPQIEVIPCGVPAATVCGEINHKINRDQVVLCFAGLSVTRLDPNYDKLVLFDQILGGGVLGSLSSRLFQLREQTGLFYTINGSVVAGANELPGMVIVKTIVSLDRLKEAEEAILGLLRSVVDSVDEQELMEARQAISTALINNFESNMGIASAFLVLSKYNLPDDYFDNRSAMLEKVTLESLKEAVHKVLKVDSLVTVRVGRV